MIKILFIPLLIFTTFVFTQEKSAQDEFTFVFMTDIHIQSERNAAKGFVKAIKEVNKLNPDFVITGGDLIYDALGVSFERADSLYNLYTETIKLAEVPVYNTIGNHEIFGWYKKSNVEREHPEFGKKMYENRIGKQYYTFEHKGVKFFILDSIEEVPDSSKYFGNVNEEQVEWIKTELLNIDSVTPIIISTHIPFITTLSQIRGGSRIANSEELVVENSKDVLSLFDGHNLKLVLQGHLHYFEEIDILKSGKKIKFITGGAVSSRWWRGKSNEGLEEGFLIVKVRESEIFTEYYDYGWEVESSLK